MSRFSVIYVKRTERTPAATTITFAFPDGQSVVYESANIILENFTKEYIVEKRFFPYIPFYIARYEKDITSESSIEDAVEDLEYFKNEMIRLHKNGELSDDEIVDLMGFANTIITHITNGNKNEERLVNIMGGTVIETESEKLIRKGKEIGMAKGREEGKIEGKAEGRIEGKAEGKAEGRIEGKAEEIIGMGQEFGLDDAAILKRLQEKIGLPLEKAMGYLEKYGKQLV